MNATITKVTDVVAVARHTALLLIIAVTGVASITLVYSQVDVNSETTKNNEEDIKGLRSGLSDITATTKLIVQQIENEKERSKEFRERTDHSLNRILERLVPTGQP